jgi:hypothetical protein
LFERAASLEAKTVLYPHAWDIRSTAGQEAGIAGEPESIDLFLHAARAGLDLPLARSFPFRYARSEDAAVFGDSGQLHRTDSGLD